MTLPVMRKIKEILHLSEKRQVKNNFFTNDLLLPHQPYHDDFLQTMTRLLRWSKWIGIVGLEHFAWKTYGIIILALYLVIEVDAIWKVIKALAGWAIDMAAQRSVSARLSGSMFYTACLLGLIQCWKFSSSWKEISKYWASIEWVLSVKYVPPDPTLKKRMYMTMVIIAVCTTIEHIFNVLPSLDFNCIPSLCLRHYILKSHGFLLLEFEYYDVIGVPLLFMSIAATIQWNLQDLIIILTSMGLTSRYRRLNQCVAKVATMNSQENGWSEDTQFLRVYLWRKIREAYVRQAMLVRRVDEPLSRLIIISAFFNFYFIVLSLFLGITQLKGKSPLEDATYAVTIIWLFARTGLTLVTAANVNKYSTLALPYLYECSAQCYNVEIERLQKQLIKDYVALSGMGFFYLNRMVVLQMSGAIVTYVLVLVQYDV